jgi:two-component system, chemotaxis family, chemotaxis protein CheY
VRALIVDDSRAMRLVIGRIMTDLGFEIADAANGREALDRLTAGPVPNVALVDWNMPEMNGFELVCALRANDRYRATRIVMVTTEVEMGQVVRALEAGADEYVMKPFTKDVLREKLELLQLVSD